MHHGAVFSLHQHQGRVNTCKYLSTQQPTSNFLLSGGQDQTVRLFNGPALLHEFKGGHHAGDVLDLDFAHGANRIASVGIDKAAVLWDVSSGLLFGRLHGHQARINACSFRTNDNNTLATGSHDGMIKIWDCRSKVTVQTLIGFKDAVTGVCVDEFCITGTSLDGSIRVFDVRMGKIDMDSSKYPIGSMAKSRDKKCILVSCMNKDAMLKILESSSGKTLKSFTGHGNTTVSLGLCFDHLDARVASGSEDGIVRFWDLVKGNIVLSIKIPGEDAILGISHHPATNSFMVCGKNGTLKCYAS